MPISRQRSYNIPVRSERSISGQQQRPFMHNLGNQEVGPGRMSGPSGAATSGESPLTRRIACGGFLLGVDVKYLAGRRGLTVIQYSEIEPYAQGPLDIGDRNSSIGWLRQRRILLT